MTVNIKKKGRRIDKSDISALEQRIGVELPGDYKKFLAENNGGIPETNEFDIPGLNGGSGINEFLSIDEIEALKTRLGERFLSSAWPVAHAEGGNYLCLVVGEKAGIYFWDHELEAEEGHPASWENMFLLADNFSDFWSSLRQFDVSKVELKPDQVQKVWANPDFKPEF